VKNLKRTKIRTSEVFFLVFLLKT